MKEETMNQQEETIDVICAHCGHTNRGVPLKVIGASMWCEKCERNLNVQTPDAALVNRHSIRAILDGLMEVEEKEGDSHALLDDAFSNICYGNLSEQRRQHYINNTGTATELHASAMDQLRRLTELLRDLISVTR